MRDIKRLAISFMPTFGRQKVTASGRTDVRVGNLGTHGRMRPGSMPTCEVRHCHHAEGCRGFELPTDHDAYSTRRSYGEALAVARMVAYHATEGRYSYLITHTMQSSYCDLCRRKKFRDFIDVLRKEHGLYSYFWTTEVHNGGGFCDGLIHHHLYAVFQQRWNYKGKIQRWSMLYGGSVNGLDVKKRDSPFYLIKYLQKEQGGDQKLPFRWWGCSQMPRNYICSDEFIPVMTLGQSRVIVVPGEIASRACAEYNADFYTMVVAIRQHRRIEKIQARRRAKRRRQRTFDMPYKPTVSNTNERNS